MKHTREEHMKKHFDNLNRLEKGEDVTVKDYDYLGYCFECGKEFTWFDRITFNMIHCFAGNCHRRDCK